MAVLTSTNATEGLNMLTGGQFVYDSWDSVGNNSSTQYSWISTDGSDVQAIGSGITWTQPGGDPATGTITELQFDFNNDNFAVPDVVITGFSGSLVTMTAGSGLLNEVFGGNDTINGTTFNDYLKGVAGADSILGGDGNDTILGGNDNDTIRGGIGDDSIFGDAGNDWIYGDTGLNTIHGGSGNDRIYEGGNDTIFAEDGNDILILDDSGVGADSFDGGAGTDWVYFTAFSNAGRHVDLFNGVYRLSLNSATTEVMANFENILGGSGAETFSGTNGANQLYGNAGNDSIYANGGNDTLVGGDGNDYLSGGNDNDIFIYAAGTAFGNDTILGGGGTDTLLLQNAGAFDFTGMQMTTLEEIEFQASANQTKTITLLGNEVNDAFSSTLLIDGNANTGGEDRIVINQGTEALSLTLWTFQDWADYAGVGTDLITINGTAGADSTFATQRSDFVRGYGGNDTLFGANGNDTLLGGDGNDSVLGARGDDYLAGEGDNDIVVGRIGNDTIFGGAGLDDVIGGVGSDLIYGGSGDDTVRGQGDNDTLYGESGNDFIPGGAGDDLIFAGTEADQILGQPGNDTIYGGAGNDTLHGGGGRDSLLGEDGNDVLNGYVGRDTMDGGAGADTFVYDSALHSGVDVATRDIINGWDALDVIDLSLIDANTAAGFAGNDTFIFVGAGAHTGNGGTLRYYQSGGNTFIGGDTTGDGLDDFGIQLTGLHALTAGDFVL